jgi:DNA repair exonuclease SbcCD nuclease subunit
LRRPLRLVHTADVHLGELPTPWHGREPSWSGDRRRRPDVSGRTSEGWPPPGNLLPDERAFARVIDIVLAEEADALLIAGDLFDSNRVPEPAIRFAQSQIARVSCPVVLIPGNHDCYDDTSIYRRFDFRAIGSHVYPLYAEAGEIVVFEHMGLAVWGKGLVEHAPANRPMAGAPQRAVPDHWLVGMAHGHFVEDRREPRSSLITPDEIEGSGLDYLALGHVHVFRDVSQGSVRACYPGAPRISYAPDAGSVAIIRLDPVAGISVEERRLGATILEPEDLGADDA